MPGQSSRADRPRLLFVVNVSWFFISHRLPLAREAVRAGYRVALATRLTDPAHARTISEAGIEVYDINIERATAGPVSDLRSLLELTRLIRSLRVDIVHLVAIKPMVIGGLAARLGSARAVVAAASGLGHAFTDLGWWPALRRSIVVRVLRFVCSQRRCRVIFQNDEDRALLVRLGAVPPAITRLIRGAGVDLRVFAATPEPPSPLCVLLPARMLRAKGIEEFIAAARELRPRWPQVRFLLAGDVDVENPTSLTTEEVRAGCAASGVEWLGHVSDMADLLSRAHIVTLASHDREGLPKSLLEAAAVGRPIVATDIPGIREIVLPEVNGVLVKPRDAHDLARGIERLLGDAELRRRFGAAGRELVEKHFGLDRVVASTLEVYAELQAMP